MTVSKLKLGTAIAAIVALSAAAIVTADTASAGKPGGSGKPSGGGGAAISLDQADPHLGDWVTFSTSGGSTVTVNCFQGGLGNMVYAERLPVGSSFQLGLGDSEWQTGPATCVAYLYSRSKYLAQTSFEAAGAR